MPRPRMGASARCCSVGPLAGVEGAALVRRSFCFAPVALLATKSSSQINSREFSMLDISDQSRQTLLTIDGHTLIGVRLSGKYLRGAELPDVDLSNADLRDCNLRDANLRRSRFDGAILDSTDFRGACLDGVDLSKATWKGKVLVERASFRGATLTGCNLMELDLIWCNFEDADLSRALLHGSRLINANFRRAKLDGTQFFANDFSFARFEGTDLSNVGRLQGRNLDISFFDDRTRFPTIMSQVRAVGFDKIGRSALVLGVLGLIAGGTASGLMVGMCSMTVGAYLGADWSRRWWVRRGRIAGVENYTWGTDADHKNGEK